MEDTFERIRRIVQAELSCAAHDFSHVERVYALCMKLADGEQVDWDVLRAAALLHDVARVKEDSDPSGNTDHAELSARFAADLLPQFGFTSQQVRHVEQCILAHRYRSERKPETLEAKILFDADKLDSVGAIGIARTFFWAAQDEAQMYREISAEDYAKENLVGGTIDGRICDVRKHSPNLEYETKLKYVCDRLYTKKAKKMCAGRMDVLRSYFERLRGEIRGEC